MIVRTSVDGRFDKIWWKINENEEEEKEIRFEEYAESAFLISTMREKDKKFILCSQLTHVSTRSMQKSTDCAFSKRFQVYFEKRIQIF